MTEDERKTLKAEIMADLEEKICSKLPFLQKNEVANYADKTEETLLVIVGKIWAFERRLRVFEEKPRTLNLMGYIDRMEEALYKKEYARNSIERLDKQVYDINRKLDAIDIREKE